MSRIRSIHPGIYTDEAWASVSIAARWFAKGLCTEADDNGTFEWKPLQLKMRIFPADAVDVPALLAELTGAGIVMAFTADGKSLGSLKNFCRYQRPRKPKAWFPTTPESLAFAAVGTPGPSDDEPEAPPVPQKSVPAKAKTDPVPPKSEMSSQMEDEGGKRKEVATVAIAPVVVAATPRPAKRCPEAWLPSDADLKVGLDSGLNHGEIRGEFDKFRDHTFGTARSDWSATFRNWLRTAAERKPKARNVQYQPDQRQAAREDNLARALAGAEAASRFRAVGG